MREMCYGISCFPVSEFLFAPSRVNEATKERQDVILVRKPAASRVTLNNETKLTHKARLRVLEVTFPIPDLDQAIQFGMAGIGPHCRRHRRRDRGSPRHGLCLTGRT